MNKAQASNLREFENKLVDLLHFEFFSAFRLGQHELRFITKCGAQIILCPAKPGEVSFAVLDKDNRILSMITCDISSDSKVNDSLLDVLALIAANRKQRKFGEGIG